MEAMDGIVERHTSWQAPCADVDSMVSSLRCTGCVRMGNLDISAEAAVTVPIAAHIITHGTLCGAPLLPNATLAWVREKVLQRYKLPDLTDLEFDVKLSPAGGLRQLMRMYHMAAVERASRDIKASLPASLLLCHETYAFALIPEAKAPRLAVYRLSSPEPPPANSRRVRAWRCDMQQQAAPQPTSAKSSEPGSYDLPQRDALPAVRQMIVEAVQSLIDGLEVAWCGGDGPAPGVEAATAMHQQPAARLPVLLIRVKPTAAQSGLKTAV
ncbi:hypothetical protein GPECTOR_16g685 [Gonium pectorale]|uniref:Uncharacterized protein n=1 Tax=Gonium pectorale TaxID=33097 RepID=A0A150GMF4_GONPE|nr:hypothetical protein GPECTOR_16g685 [Gonium pectorale]|eukprot:KXZ50510.1 hypothetical protein GPECTOR_16g685 [Gonium pectorale]